MIRRFSGKPRAAFALVTGVLVLVVWVGLIVSSFAGASESANRLFADVLLALVAVSVLASLVASVRWGIVSALAGAAYAAAWWYIGWALLYSIADVAYYGLVVAFFVAPPVAGAAGILAARARMARAG